MGSGDKYFENDGVDSDHIDITIATASDITFHATDGTETATEKYLNKGSLGKGFILRPSDNVSIVSIGSKTFRNPIPVSTAGFTMTTHLKDFESIVIRTHNASTNISLIIL